jgi:hypothetical protein
MAPVGLLDKPVTGLDESTGTTCDGATLASYVEDMWKLVGADQYGCAVKTAPVGSVPPAPVKMTGILNTAMVPWYESVYSGMLSADTLLMSQMYAQPRGPRSSPVQLAGLARAAADLIEKHGWCQGRLKDFEGRYCALGALQAAGASEDDLREFNAHAIRWLDEREYGGSSIAGYPSVMRWNDAPGRTAAEVTGMLRSAAAALKATQALPGRDIHRMPVLAY